MTHFSSAKIPLTHPPGTMTSEGVFGAVEGPATAPNYGVLPSNIQVDWHPTGLPSNVVGIWSVYE